MIAKFDDFERWRCVDLKGIVAPEIGSKSVGTSEKQALGYHRNPNYDSAVTLHAVVMKPPSQPPMT